MLRLLILVQILFTSQFLCQSEINLISNVDSLISVAVIYRHGDRTPLSVYPTDPYRNESYWPVDFGQLTNIGKVEQYQLGQWLRERYKDLLPAKYSEKDIYVRSTDHDRTLMSAETNLAGLYPAQGNQIWNKDLSWQPIPVHTIANKNDYMFGSKSCPRYDSLMKSLLSTTEFINIHKENHDLYAYLARNTGTSILNLFEMEYIYNTLFIEQLYNFTLPEWTTKVFPKKMQPWADFSFAVPCYTQDMAKLKVGPFLNEIVEHFKNSTQGQGYKMLSFSAHDTTIANILMALKAFKSHSPPYSSAILFELHSLDKNYYINILYKHATVPELITLKDCEYNCPFNKFLSILKPIRLNYKEWEDECQMKFLGVLPFTTLQTSIFTSCLVVFTILVIILIFSIIFTNRRNIRQNYFRIPNEEA